LSNITAFCSTESLTGSFTGSEARITLDLLSTKTGDTELAAQLVSETANKKNKNLFIELKFDVSNHFAFDKKGLFVRSMSSSKGVSV
jgi:hypothetical protein